MEPDDDAVIEVPAVPTSSFYGGSTSPSSRWTAKLNGLRAANARARATRDDGLFIWKVFSRQEPAFRYADGRRIQGLAVWAFEERSNPGKRRYLVCRKDDFWLAYRAMPDGQRHFYEIIREATPCRLYFDCEFSLDINFLRDGPAMVRSLVSVTLARIRSVFGIVAGEDSVLSLDSSTPSKFSRHLIFHLPNAAFRNNAVVGQLVRDVCADLEALARAMPAAEASLYSPLVVDEKGKEALFVDQSVYSRNRNLRLVGSSKVGKATFFALAKDNRFPVRHEKEPSFFLDSLASHVDFSHSLRLLDYRSIRDTSRAVHRGDHSPSAEYESVRSPFPDIDAWVARQLADRPGRKGRIKSVVWFPGSATITYAVDGNRYCGVIGREHRSNGTYCFVNLHTGLLNWRCFDFECGRRGSSLKLPSALLRSTEHESDDEAEDAMDDIPDEDLLELIQQGSQQWD
ncbi:hypothetical protein DFJ74DRAFT_493814 [Hyaloraphidium curvatum]|nr:hypothetical protein DFJ74DRAFT_493814 [Hyaloraphidium curvatum]